MPRGQRRNVENRFNHIVVGNIENSRKSLITKIGNGDREGVRKILEYIKENDNSSFPELLLPIMIQDENALDIAIKSNNSGIVKDVLYAAKSADNKYDLTKKVLSTCNKSGNYPIHEAVKIRNNDILKEILDATQGMSNKDISELLLLERAERLPNQKKGFNPIEFSFYTKYEYAVVNLWIKAQDVINNAQNIKVIQKLSNHHTYKASMMVPIAKALIQTDDYEGLESLFDYVVSSKNFDKYKNSLSNQDLMNTAIKSKKAETVKKLLYIAEKYSTDYDIVQDLLIPDIKDSSTLDNKNSSTLDTAYETENPEIIKLLIISANKANLLSELVSKSADSGIMAMKLIICKGGKESLISSCKESSTRCVELQDLIQKAENYNLSTSEHKNSQCATESNPIDTYFHPLDTDASLRDNMLRHKREHKLDQSNVIGRITDKIGTNYSDGNQQKQKTEFMTESNHTHTSHLQPNLSPYPLQIAGNSSNTDLTAYISAVHNFLHLVPVFTKIFPFFAPIVNSTIKPIINSISTTKSTTTNTHKPASPQNTTISELADRVNLNIYKSSNLYGSFDSAKNKQSNLKKGKVMGNKSTKKSQKVDSKDSLSTMEAVKYDAYDSTPKKGKVDEGTRKNYYKEESIDDTANVKLIERSSAYKNIPSHDEFEDYLSMGGEASGDYE